MTLKGNLEVLNLSDIFQSLSLNQHTGTLRVTDGKREKLVHFAQGEITLLASEKKVKIGEMLVAAGKISQEDLEFALQQQKKSKKRLGEILVEEGFVSEDDIAEIVKQQIEAEIYDLFLWKKAEFEFLIDYIPEKLKNPSHGITKLQFNTSSLIMEALRRLDEWSIISKEITTLKEVYKVVNASPSALEEIDLPDRIKSEIKLVDGEKTLEQIAEETSLSEFELCKLIYELKSRGVVAPLTPQELAERAEEAFGKGKFRQAAALYERLVEVLPKNLSIRWHFAEAAKAFGDETRALEQYLFVAQALEGTRDRQELARAYRAILDLAPDRKEILEKLRALDKEKMQRSFFRAIAILLIFGGLAGAATFAIAKFEQLHWLRDKIIALVKGDDPTGPQTPMEVQARDLLKGYQKALEGGHYEHAFDLGMRLLKGFPASRAKREVSLPLVVASDPQGKDVYLDGEKQKAATDCVVLYPPKPEGTVLRVEIKDGERVLHSQTVDAGTFHKVSVTLFKSPKWLARTAGPIRGTPVFRGDLKTGVAYFASLDGNLHGRLLEDSENAASVFTTPLSSTPEGPGFPVAGLVASDDLVFYGTIDGEIHGFNVSSRQRVLQARTGKGAELPKNAIFGDPILALPVITDDGQSIAFATYEGTVYLLGTRRSDNPVPIAQMGGKVVAPLAESDGMIFVGSTDNRVVAIDARARRDVWWYQGMDDFVAAPRPVSDTAVVVGDLAGIVACLDRKSGVVLWTYDAGAPVTGIEWLDDRVFVATALPGRGELTAIALADGQSLWRIPAPKKPGRPIMAGGLVVVPGEGAMTAYEPPTGFERWTARPIAKPSGPPVTFLGVPVVYMNRIFIGADDGVLYGFDAE